MIRYFKKVISRKRKDNAGKMSRDEKREASLNNYLSTIPDYLVCDILIKNELLQIERYMGVNPKE